MNVLAKGYRANVKYSIANELTILTMWTHVVTDLGERSCLAMCNKNYCQVSEVISFLCLIFFLSQNVSFNFNSWLRCFRIL